MPLDGTRIERACRGADVLQGRQLCRAELDRGHPNAALAHGNVEASSLGHVAFGAGGSLIEQVLRLLEFARVK